MWTLNKWIQFYSAKHSPLLYTDMQRKRQGKGRKCRWCKYTKRQLYKEGLFLLWKSWPKLLFCFLSLTTGAIINLSVASIDLRWKSHFCINVSCYLHVTHRPNSSAYLLHIHKEMNVKCWRDKCSWDSLWQRDKLRSSASGSVTSGTSTNHDVLILSRKQQGSGIPQSSVQKPILPLTGCLTFDKQLTVGSLTFFTCKICPKWPKR